MCRPNFYFFRFSKLYADAVLKINIKWLSHLLLVLKIIHEIKKKIKENIIVLGNGLFLGLVGVSYK